MIEEEEGGKKVESVPPKPLEVNKAIRKSLEKINPKLDRLRNLDYIATGFTQEGIVTFREAVAGDYFGAFNHGTTLKLEGSAANYLGLNLTKGDIIVTKNTGDFTATYQSGGIIVVRGNCGNYTGQGMLGGILFIEGNCGDFTGREMVDGEIIVVGDCGKNTGVGMKGGAIFVRGEIGGIGKGAKSVTLSTKDKNHLQGIFKDFELDYHAKDFVKVVPGVKE
ncbi:MAG TPA: hypothetical protein EYP29_01560 [Thermoplasmata archaeon]|nr:hypothetical protein [Thermoplasmata archaeon]